MKVKKMNGLDCGLCTLAANRKELKLNKSLWVSLLAVTHVLDSRHKHVLGVFVHFHDPADEFTLALAVYCAAEDQLEKMAQFSLDFASILRLENNVEVGHGKAGQCMI